VGEHNCLGGKAFESTVILLRCEAPNDASKEPWKSINATTVGGYVYYQLKDWEGQCLGVAGASTANGHALAVGNCTSTRDHSQLWRASFTNRAHTRYTLVNAHSGKCAGTVGSKATMNTKVIQGTCYTGSGTSQIWYSTPF
jgi:hypothetical protein